MRSNIHPNESNYDP